MNIVDSIGAICERFGERFLFGYPETVNSLINNDLLPCIVMLMPTILPNTYALQNSYAINLYFLDLQPYMEDDFNKFRIIEQQKYRANNFLKEIKKKYNIQGSINMQVVDFEYNVQAIGVVSSFNLIENTYCYAN